MNRYSVREVTPRRLAVSAVLSQTIPDDDVSPEDEFIPEVDVMSSTYLAAFHGWRQSLRGQLRRTEVIEKHQSTTEITYGASKIHTFSEHLTTTRGIRGCRLHATG